MIASYSARVLWSSSSVSWDMYFISILLDAPFFNVSFPSAVISDIISTWGRSAGEVISNSALRLHCAGDINKVVIGQFAFPTIQSNY